MQDISLLNPIKEYNCKADGSTDGVVLYEIKNDVLKVSPYKGTGSVYIIIGAQRARESTYNAVYGINISSSMVDVGGVFPQLYIHSPKNRCVTKTNPNLQKKLHQDDFLRQTYDFSVAEIERILQTQRKNCEIVGYAWEDQESEDWKENVIEVKTDFQNFEEKEDLWDVLGSTLENIQQDWAKLYDREIGEDVRPFILRLSRTK